MRRFDDTNIVGVRIANVASPTSVSATTLILVHAGCLCWLFAFETCMSFQIHNIFSKGRTPCETFFTREGQKEAALPVAVSDAGKCLVRESMPEVRGTCA